ncbi:RNA binding protein [Marine Group I thaumarchaeote SCGC AAA799-E16]|uniref:UPF0201 protein AAA799N04_00975 n=3 Tax=Marine Group I TaxID=905826 RepID=A0A081RN06_9ARCH|nr:RNA binding protein [Marine Group I thaumarchaeote SCGC AAA799-N04]KER06796.1 RNA binding protein [Marine Group I thaumarchaeote SCGC AAA799-E16]KFM15849.1 RNA binding protein [Marine Group I thaumarchaeote SCGC RSA3]
MKTPNFNCKIEMFCTINPSEDSEKTQKAISNIFPYSEIKAENSSVYAESKDLNSLEKVYEIVHSKQSQKTYRRNMQKNLRDDSTWFYLNKQAAFVEKIAICEESGESPLGPIKVILTSSKIDEIIDWFVYGDEN